MEAGAQILGRKVASVAVWDIDKGYLKKDSVIANTWLDVGIGGQLLSSQETHGATLKNSPADSSKSAAAAHSM